MKKNDNQLKPKNTGFEEKKGKATSAVQQTGRASEQVKAHSTRDVNGASGTRNTGTNVSYEDKES